MSTDLERREHQRAYPPFHASFEAAGCGPIVGDELTDKQRLYLAEYETYLTEHLLPWKKRAAELAATANPDTLFDLAEGAA